MKDFARRPEGPRSSASSVGPTFVALLMLVGATAAGEATARAQDPGNLATADALFDQGRLLMVRGEYPDACSKFAASLRIDIGVGTMLYLAECYLRSGRMASAWAQFREAAAVAASRQDAREALARERAAQLEPHLARLSVALSGPEVPGTVVRRDGQPLDRAVWTSPIPVDPGQHVVEVSAPNKRSFVAKISVSPEAGEFTVRVPTLENLAAPEGAPVVVPSALAVTEPSPPKPASAPAPTLGVQRKIALVAGGLGLVAATAGAYWGLHAKSLWDDSNGAGQCDPNGTACQSRVGVQDRGNAGGQATLSTAAFAVAGIAMAAAVVLWVTAPRARVRVALAASWGQERGLVVVGGF